MALSPSIPTSFVPKQPVSTGGRRYSGGTNIFLLIAIFILVVAVVASIGVFLYSSYLDGVVAAKGAQLQTAQANANPDTVQQFVRLRNRFSAEKMLIDQHIALSQFFTVFEGITLKNVHFNSLTVNVASDRSAKIDMDGTAASFNALAAESTAFASSKYVKSAIFSDIKVGSDGTVSFTITADLDPSIVIESAAPTTPALISTSTPAIAPVLPVTTATTTATTTTKTAAKGPTTTKTTTAPSTATTPATTPSASATVAPSTTQPATSSLPNI